MVSIGEKFNAFGEGVKNATQNVGNGIAKAAHLTASVVTDVSSQQKVEQDFRSGIDTFYSGTSNLTNRLVEAMEHQGVQTLHAPIKRMKDLHIPRLTVNQGMSSNSKTIRKGINGLITYHERTIKTTEKISRLIGQEINALVRLALTPIRFTAKVLQVEVAGAMIQNSIALIAGFIARGITMVIMQVGHILPYAFSAALISGTAFGLSMLAIHVSPLAAIAVAITLVLVAQQAQITQLSKKIEALSNALRKSVRQMQENNATNGQPASSSFLNTLYTNKSKILATLVLAGLSFHYRGNISKFAKPYAEKASKFAKPHAEKASKLAKHYTGRVVTAYKNTSKHMTDNCTEMLKKLKLFMKPRS